MFANAHHNSRPPRFRKKTLLRSSIRYFKTGSPKKDLKSLTLEDFRPPIALKTEFPKIKKTRQLPSVNFRRKISYIGDLYIKGEYACVENKFSPALQHNIGLDTMDFLSIKDLSPLYY